MSRALFVASGAAVLLLVGCDWGTDPSAPEGEQKLEIEVTPPEVVLAVGEAVDVNVRASVPGGTPGVALDVESGDEAIVGLPGLADFTTPLPAQSSPGPGQFTFDSTGKADSAQVTLICKGAGSVLVTFTLADPDSERSTNDGIDITCKPPSVDPKPTRCLVPFANETLLAVDADGNLVETPGWGKGAAQRGAVSVSGGTSRVFMAGYGQNSEPTLWLSEAFDPAHAGPASWTTVSQPGVGQFSDVAVRGAGAVLASADVGLFLYENGSLTPATSPDSGAVVACDDAGACVSSAIHDGGILRTTDGLNWTNIGVGSLGPLIYCRGTFIGYDAFNGVQLRSTDGGMTWTAGDLSAFNLRDFACGKDSVVASGQTGTWVSRDDGATWTAVDDTLGWVSYSPTADAFFSVGPSAAGPTVWISSDAGETWTQTDDLGMAGAENDVVCY